MSAILLRQSLIIIIIILTPHLNATRSLTQLSLKRLTKQIYFQLTSSLFMGNSSQMPSYKVQTALPSTRKCFLITFINYFLRRGQALLVLMATLLTWHSKYSTQIP